VTCLLEAGVLTPAETAVARNDSTNTHVARHWLGKCHVTATRLTHFKLKNC
jgi:hypothetical protein